MNRWLPPLRGLLVFLLVAGSAQRLPAQNGPLRGFDAYVEKALREWGVPGLAVAVVKDDSVVFARGYGVRHLGRPEPVDAHTLFSVASTSKAFTVALLGMLADEDRLKWDDPAAKHLPGFQLYDPYVSRELTVRDLLSHRSGLSRGDYLWWASPYDREEILRRVRFLRPSTSFRSAFGYQNVMFIAAGQIIPAVTDTTWDDAVRARIFRPLGMSASNTSIAALRGGDNVATPHARIDDRLRSIAWRNFDNLGGAGAINSNAIDMAQWVRLQLGRGEYKGKRLLSPERIRETWTPQTVIRASEQTDSIYPETHFRAYGLGWFLQDYRGRKVVYHPGALDGMRAEVAMIPEENLGVVLLANAEETALLPALRYRIFDLFLGRVGRDWSGDLLAVRNRDRREAEAARDSTERARIPGTKPSLPLSEYTGMYRDSMYGDASMVREGERLVLRIGPSFTGDLEHWHLDTYRAVWRDPYLGKSFVTFTIDAAGQVRRMEVEDWAVFERVPPGSADATSTTISRPRD